MINKFKDFLKKFSRRKHDDFSDQEDISEEVTGLHDQTSDEHLTKVKPSWKNRFKITFPSLRKKGNSTPGEDSPLTTYKGEDSTGEVPASHSKGPLANLKERFSTLGLREWKLPQRMKNKHSDSVFSLSPSLSKSTERFLSRSARESIHQAFLVTLICSLTYSLGKVTALALKGPPTVDSARDFTVAINLNDNFQTATLLQVKTINIFRTNTGLGQKKPTVLAKCDEADKPSNLPIKLMNTIVLQDQIKSLASVQVRGDRDLQEVRIGDQISNLAKIFKIGRLNIIIRNLESGTCEFIASDKLRETRSPISVMSPTQSRAFVANKKIPGIENVGNKFSISKNLLNEKIKDLGSVLDDARAIKMQNPDGTLSFKLTEIDPEGLFPFLGLQDQDIISSINGKPIYGMNEIMDMFSKIKNLDKLQLGIRRDGSETTLDYNIQK